MKTTILALCEHNQSEMENFAEKTIQTEKAMDRIHDEIIERMYSRESLVFSRDDRLLLVNQMDNVVDAAEVVVRRASVYFPESIPMPLVTRFIAVMEKVYQTGIILNDAICAVFNDFDLAYQFAHQIEDIRREAKKDYMEFLRKLYEVKPDYRDMLYYDRLIRNIMITINTINKIAADIRRLIAKYRL